MDYSFINWYDRYPEGHRVPSSYPLLYDRSLSNHGGGIYVLKVGGEIIWDPGAAWLQCFSREHPEYSIPLPVGLESATGEKSSGR
jgi:hypothetical protein